MLKLFDSVTLKNDDPETGVKAGTEGTIVDVLGNGKAFTVEFFDEDGNTIEASLYGEPQKELAKKAQGKSVVHIHNTDIQEVTIVYPSRTEQDRIVSVFRQLDHLITLHQRELKKLQNIKKSMLEKMFV